MSEGIYDFEMIKSTFSYCLIFVIFCYLKQENNGDKSRRKMDKIRPVVLEISSVDWDVVFPTRFTVVPCRKFYCKLENWICSFVSCSSIRELYNNYKKNSNFIWLVERRNKIVPWMYLEIFIFLIFFKRGSVIVFVVVALELINKQLGLLCSQIITHILITWSVRWWKKYLGAFSK